MGLTDHASCTDVAATARRTDVAATARLDRRPCEPRRAHRDLDAILRDCYRAATLLPDGRSRRGRKTKHDTATRRWCESVGWPALTMGKRPSASDLSLLQLSPRSSLSGATLKARDAWSQLHGRDPRSKRRTAEEAAGQQTLLAWARINMASALTPATVRRGRTNAWRIDFGRSWRGYGVQAAQAAA